MIFDSHLVALIIEVGSFRAWCFQIITEDQVLKAFAKDLGGRASRNFGVISNDSEGNAQDLGGRASKDFGVVSKDSEGDLMI